jgi:hypothetical protein
MRLSLPSQRLVPIVLIGALAVVFLAVAAGRLGGGSSGTDSSNADAVIEKAFGNSSFKSGRFEATARASLEGAPSPQLGRAELRMTGVFEGAPRSPKAAVDVSLDAGGEGFELGFVSTGDAAFMRLGDRAYRLPPDAVKQSREQSQSQSTVFAALGVDPRSWLTNAKDEGSARVGGVETTHVSADVNVDRMLDDVFRLAEQAGQSGAANVSAEDRNQIEGAVEDASIDVYAAKSDGTLRKLSGQLSIDAPSGSQQQLSGSGTVSFDMEFSEVNKPQRVTAPSGALPFSRFQGDFQRSVLGGLGTSRAGGSEDRTQAPRDSGGGTPPGAETETPAPGTSALPESAREYLECVSTARTSAAVEQCTPLLD